MTEDQALPEADTLRVMVVSASPWARNNSFGSTYSSIFGAIPDVEISSLYCGAGESDDPLVKHAFQITEAGIIRALFGRYLDGGPIVESAGEVSNVHGKSAPLDRVLQAFRVKRFSFYRFARAAQEAIWLLGTWRSQALRDFVREARPHVIVQPVYGRFYMIRLARFVKSLANVPMVGYVSDDVYSLRQFSLSPIFWVDRLLKRRALRRVLRECEWLYVVSDLQKREYQRSLKMDCRVLTKLSDFHGVDRPPLRTSGALCDEVVFTYAGNIGNGRWKSLAAVGQAIAKANALGSRARLDVFTGTPIGRTMRRHIDQPGSIRLHGPVNPAVLQQRYADSDVLVLAEPTDLRGRLSVRLSISTKLVEYLHAGRPILARGTSAMAGIQHLQAGSAALTSTPDDDLDTQVLSLIRDRELRGRLAEAGWQLGLACHDTGTVGHRVGADLRGLAREG